MSTTNHPGFLRRAFRAFADATRPFGFDPNVFAQALLGVPPFFRDWLRYQRSPGAERMPIRVPSIRPSLTDRRDSAGAASGHYFHQDLWAARKIFAAKPRRHVDVGSRIDGFVAHVLTFMPVEVLDVRSLTSTIDRLVFVQGDATDLATFPTDSLESVSSLHAVEHFGLGRYGDPVDPDACFRAMRSLARVLKPGGRLYFSVPIGVERVEFNSHRVFAPATVLREFEGLRLVSFSAVDDAGGFHLDVDPNRYIAASYSCGLFEFTKAP